MKINWLLIAWWLIPILGWTSVILIATGSSMGWTFLYITVGWVAVCVVWGLIDSEISDKKIYEDALINRKLMERDDENRN